jgi:glucuronoarabinoxylan endo-1,4-beta-xylanase
MGGTGISGAASGGTPALGGAPASGGMGPLGGAPPMGGMPGAGGASGGTPASGGANLGGAGAGGAPSGVVVKLDATHQTIQGFGLNDALSPSGSSFSATVLDNLFTTKNADSIGLSILRIGMTPTGSLNGSTQSDIDGVKTRGGKIIGSCWSPPANCKSNNSTQDGGHVNTSCYDSWSTTIANFAGQYGLYAMSIGNEPDFASCGSSEPCNGNYDTTLYTANEMVAFVKVAGPKLKAKNVKVIAPEASEWLHTWSNTSASGSVPSNKNSSDPLKCGFPATNTACTTGSGYDYGHFLAKDATAWGAFDIIGVHEYDTQHAEPWPSDVTAARKEVWQTEMSGVKWWPEQGPSSDINNGVAVAGWIHSALVTGEASAWLYWWYQAYYTDDNEGLLLKSGGSPTKRYYTLGNYSKFVRPGYVMVEVQGNSNADVLLSAFKGPNGEVAVVAVNKGASAVTMPITITGGTAPASLTPNVTSGTDNLKAGTAVAVSGGAFTATLASKTVTTFVSQ